MTVTDTLVDFSVPGTLGVFPTARAWRGWNRTSGGAASSRRPTMAQTFDWLRGNDLVWNYVCQQTGTWAGPHRVRSCLPGTGTARTCPAADAAQYLQPATLTAC